MEQFYKEGGGGSLLNKGKTAANGGTASATGRTLANHHNSTVGSQLAEADRCAK